MDYLSNTVGFFRKYYLLTGLVLLLSYPLLAQSILYSTPLKEERINTWFETIGRYDQKILILKNLRSKYYISVYNDKMEWLENIDLTDIPDKAYGIEVLPLKDAITIWYRHTKGRTTKWYALMLGTDGKPKGEPKLITTKETNFSDFKPYYYITTCEDKSRVMVTITQEIKENRYNFYNLLLDHKLDSVYASETTLDDVDRLDFFTDLLLDNDGTLVFCWGTRDGDYTNLSKVRMLTKPIRSDTFRIKELTFDKIFLDVLKVRIDNRNQRYMVTGFYFYNARETHIEGIANAIFDKASENWIIKNMVPFDSEIRKSAATFRNPRYAMDDYYLRNMLVKRDGSFTVFAEAIFPLLDNTKLSRWDNYGRNTDDDDEGFEPDEVPGFGSWHSPSYLDFTANEERYYTGNVIVLDFNNEGSLMHYNVIYKDQASGGYERALLGYQTIITSDAIHFFYNNFEKKEILLYHQVVDGAGKLTRLPAILLKNGANTTLVPSLGKQVSLRSIIVPCMEGNNLLFARIEI